MDRFDDIVIGSGLSGLGVVLGLPERRRVLVLGGAAQGAFSHYDAGGAVPCAYSGMGGLGGYWHGVIPVAGTRLFDHSTLDDFALLFSRFYPRADIGQWLGRPALFVPWKPIRPADELNRLAGQRAGALTLVQDMAQALSIEGDGVSVRTRAGQVLHASRAWVAAGAMHTPGLLATSFGDALRRRHVADHVLCYVGHVDHIAAPRTTRTPDGVFFPAYHDAAQAALYTLRPARFAFRQLDHGIEQRAAFGLPTGGAIAKILRSMSPGLLAEAFYNRFGLFAKARRYSIYAQTPVDDAYVLKDGATPLQAQLRAIRDAGERVRMQQPFGGAVLSQRPDLHIPGIHLHHSVDLQAARSVGIGGEGDRVQIVDASALQDIGPEHHSFKMLCAAYRRARATA